MGRSYRSSLAVSSPWRRLEPSAQAQQHGRLYCRAGHCGWKPTVHSRYLTIHYGAMECHKMGRTTPARSVWTSIGLCGSLVCLETPFISANLHILSPSFPLTPHNTHPHRHVCVGVSYSSSNHIRCKPWTRKQLCTQYILVNKNSLPTRRKATCLGRSYTQLQLAKHEATELDRTHWSKRYKRRTGWEQFAKLMT